MTIFTETAFDLLPEDVKARIKLWKRAESVIMFDSQTERQSATITNNMRPVYDEPTEWYVVLGE
jgi:hypothetical protein